MKDPKPFLNHREISRKGGIARAKKLSPEKRQAIASHGGRVSAAKKKSRKKDKKKDLGERL